MAEFPTVGAHDAASVIPNSRGFDVGKLFHNIHLTVWILVFAFSPLYWFMGSRFSSICGFIGSITLSPIIFWLARRRRLTSARILFVVTCNFYLLTASMGTSHSIHAEYYSIPAAMLSVLIFEPTQIYCIALTLTLPVLNWLAIILRLRGPIPDSWLFVPENPLPYSAANFLCAFLVAMLYLRYFVRAVLGAENKYVRVLENVPVGVVQMDSKYRYMEANRAFREWLGFSGVELKSMSVLDITHPDDREHTRRHLDRASTPNSAFRRVERRYLTKSGDVVWARASERALPNLTGDGENILFGAIEDITNLKIIESELADQRSLSDIQLEALNQCAIVELTDSAGTITYVNDQFCAVTGYSREELIGKNHRDMQSGIHSTEFYQEMWATIQAGKSWHGEFCNLSKSNQPIWFDTWIVPKLNAAGKPVQYTTIRYEITSKKRIESNLHETLGWQRAVLDGTLYAIISTRPDGTISTFNKSAEIMLGFSADELVGKATLDAIHDPSELKKHAEKLARELSRPIRVGVETLVAKAAVMGADIGDWTYIRRNGSRFPVRLCVTAILDTDGEIIGYLGMAEDLTETLKMQETIERQRAQMVSSAKLSSLGEMAAAIAHEINNPLAIIKGKASLLKLRIENHVDDAAEAIRDLDKIETTTERIAKIIRGLRLFSRNSDNDPMDITSLDSIIEDTIELCQERLRNSDIELRFKLQPGIKIDCRSAQISQILMNLLSNAYDAICERSERWIEIETQVVSGFVKISITDSGPGIAKATADRIMEPFYTTKEVGKGTGLGLSISKGIAEDHKGRVYYSPDRPHTCFVLELPIHIAQSDSDHLPRS